ncbi:MAG: hypothetical protein JF599_01410 [Verrucomicrobia bacterium]|nr:hypothetical protein [Verrucomicrobiota bacterium]
MKLRVLPCLLLLAAPVLAQGPAEESSPSVIESVSAHYGYSTRTGLDNNGKVGEVAVNHGDANISARLPLDQNTLFTFGFDYGVNSLDRAAGTPLPNQLSSVALDLGVKHKFSDEWGGGVSVRPGFYGDFQNLNSDSFNAPVRLLANFKQSDTLAWVFGGEYDAFADTAFVPILILNWRAEEQWTFSLGFPRTTIRYQMTDKLALRAVASSERTSYRINGNPAPAPLPNLGHTYLDYREIRLGLGANYALTRSLSLSADAGVLVHRQFDYYDRDYRLDGDTGAYVLVGITMKF